MCLVSEVDQEKRKVIEFLRSCELEQYSETFLAEGFDRMEAMIEITEHDLAELKVKLGHRRLIQKALCCLANGDIIQSCPKEPTLDYSFLTPPVNERGSFSEQDELPAKGYDRKYKRHPKPDPHAPPKPLSAYVLFSNSLRAELKDQHLSFVQLAKILGHRWKHLPLHLKCEYELCAIQAKQEYTLALKLYQQTPDFKAYKEYLVHFKREQQEENKRIMRQRKKFKKYLFKQ